MKILVLINSLYTGGAELSTLDFYQWLVKRGYQVQMVCLKVAKPSYDPLNFGFENIIYLKHGTLWQQSEELMTIIGQFKPQLLHSVLFDANVVGRIARFKTEGIVHLESLVNETYSPHRLKEPGINSFKLGAYRTLDFFTTRLGTDCYHANSDAVARHYIQKLKLSPKKIKVVYRGRKSNAHQGADKETERDEFFPELAGKTVLAHVGRHEYQKGQDVLLEAIHQLDDEVKRNLKVLLIGRDGKMSAAILHKIEAYSLGEIIHVLGHRTDVERLLALSDIFVFPSRFEGLPGALIEAEAAALPIICTDIPNNLEVVQAMENAYVHRVDDANMLSQRISHLVGNKQERMEMGQHSLGLFNSKFKRNRVYNQMKQLIDNLLDKSWP